VKYLKKFIKNQFSFLLLGFVFWLPIAVLIIIIVLIAGNFEEIGKKMLFFLPEDVFFPGMGIILCLIIVYASGILLKLTKIRSLFSKVPVLNLLFGTEEIITIEQLLHLNPCIFLYSPTCLSYGWILSEEKVRLPKEKIVFQLVNVYYPNVPALITGQVFPVRKETVVKLGNSSKEIIDILLYSFRTPKYLKYVPWEDETEEELEKRTKSFGLIFPPDNNQ
jgi:uncharacterized membrane protein